VYTREAIEGMPFRDRPTVRIAYDCETEDEDGRRTRQVRRTTARVVEGNNPWLVFWAAGAEYADRVSWELVLEVLNDPHASPVHVSNTGIVYEV
jgi:hypothetical protein